MKKDLHYRTLSLRAGTDGAPSTLDDDTRSVEVVGATEMPVDVFDFERWEVVPEVLLMSGCEMPGNRQVPLLDTHRRYGTGSVMGSYRDMAIENDQLVGRAHFSAAPEAEGPYTKLREGHLTDFSVGYRVVKSQWVPDGENAIIQGRSFDGPVKVTTRWRVKELSICPIGADELAKARSENHHPEKKKRETKKMNERLRQILEARGLPKDATEDEAWAFLARGFDKQPQDTPATDSVDVDKERTEAARAERVRCDEIRGMCDTHGCPDLAQGLIDNEATVDDARQAVMKFLEAQPEDNNIGHRGPATIAADERDKFRAAAGDALLIRSDMRPEEAATGADDLSGYSMVELARKSLRVANQQDSGNPLEMVGRALTTSDFPLILANVAHKALFAGWEGADETWNTWCATGSVSDFKTHYSPRIGEADNLDEIPESGEYKYGKRTEAQESYSVATYGKLFAVTRKTIINDDLNAITSDNFGRGEAAARKVGDVAYAVLTANAAMGDGTALFHADHSNFVADGSGAAPGVTTIAAGILAMGTQKDLRGLRRLNIRPEYLIAPKALEGATEVFFRSNNFADSDTVATDSSLAATRVNPYSGDYFTRVYEPRLDDDDAAAWYLAARKGRTVTVYFLNGNQTPYMETKQGWTVDGVEYKVRIDVGAKALDWRGFYMNDGN